ncbi:hypothetical protein HBI56_057430 [Parastagonospora nodorum]|nr:hypothetical protein HBH53_150410 [Parastagonospora nodorum]KAH4003019.1 hypothetical protein HBI10_070410 [Parastagonospora nodorum]KAH4118451.1 hypothetical protein HBH47_142380 [Parastagonospora nodorum]KAH4227265.1 hypothetical protein HBI06_109330 [Parastagonospora nodorum]KAH4248122.1 hypothetical protein HBI05_036900 [Parastagonospora nodorum]
MYSPAQEAGAEAYGALRVVPSGVNVKVIQSQPRPTPNNPKMTTNDIRNRKLRAKLAFDYEDMPMPSLPTMMDLYLQSLESPATPPPRVYPANFAPADPKTHEPAIPKDFDIASLTYTDYKALNLSFVQEHEVIGRIREEVPLIDRDQVDSIILADAGKQLKNGVFTLCRMMHIDPKAVKLMIDQQFREFYGPEVSREVSAALTPVAEVRQTVVDEADKNHAGEGNNASGSNTPHKTASTPSSPSGVELTPAPEPANKRMKLGPQEIAIEQVREDELDLKEATPEVFAAPTHDVHEATSMRNSMSVARDSMRNSIAASDRSETVPATPMPGAAKKRGKRAPPTQALKEMRAYKGLCTRRKQPCCVATLRSHAVSQKWADLQNIREA